MPRPIRRPKKAPTVAESETAVLAPVREKRLSSRIETPPQTPRRLPVRTSTPQSNDVFGFHALRDYRPAATTQTVRGIKEVIVRQDTDEEESDLSSVESMSDPGILQPAPEVLRPQKVLKTNDLLNLLPRPHKRAKRRIIEEKENESEDEEEEEQDDDEYSSRSRSRKSRPRTIKSAVKSIAAKSKRKPVVSRRQITHADSDSVVSDDDTRDSLDLSAEAKQKLDQIRAQFEVVDEWKLETESVSSQFYSDL